MIAPQSDELPDGLDAVVDVGWPSCYGSAAGVRVRMCGSVAAFEILRDEHGFHACYFSRFETMYIIFDQDTPLRCGFEVCGQVQEEAF